MPRITQPEGAFVYCAVDDFLWPWDTSTPVLMMHGFARNALFWNSWVPAIAETRRVYRPDLRRDRGFESGFLQRRVRKLSVPA